MSDNADQIAYWNDVAGAKWVANQDRLDRVFAPLTDALVAAAAVRGGEFVLDVGCGCGDLSLRLADQVGTTGQILAVDVSRPMLDHAATRVNPENIRSAPITWTRADAMTHVFLPVADLAVSRFGVMFFADQAVAFGNVRRALKPGGRFAFLCWRPCSSVEWMQWPLDRIASVLPPPEDTTGQPGPFGLADAKATCAMLTRAGFSSVGAEPVDVPLTLGAGADAIAEAMHVLGNVGRVAALLRDADAPARSEAEAVLQAALHDRAQGGDVRLGGACWLYTGQA